jgi:hypothetical protein
MEEVYRSKFTKYNHGAKCHEYWCVSYDLSGILKNGTNVKIAGKHLKYKIQK